MPAEQLILAFHDNKKFCFERAPVHSVSTFGGPMERVMAGEIRPKPLHTIARLHWMHVPGLSENHINEIPLIYGMFYSGCQLRYRVVSGGVEVLKLEGEASYDWPYPGFPLLLPYIPLRLSDVPRKTSYKQFVDAFDHPNFDDKQPTELVVVIPPPASIGLSLWAPYAGDDVMIIFECDLKNKEVFAYNICS